MKNAVIILSHFLMGTKKQRLTARSAKRVEEFEWGREDKLEERKRCKITNGGTQRNTMGQHPPHDNPPTGVRAHSTGKEGSDAF